MHQVIHFQARIGGSQFVALYWIPYICHAWIFWLRKFEDFSWKVHAYQTTPIREEGNGPSKLHAQMFFIFGVPEDVVNSWKPFNEAEIHKET